MKRGWATLAPALQALGGLAFSGTLKLHRTQHKLPGCFDSSDVQDAGGHCVACSCIHCIHFIHCILFLFWTPDVVSQDRVEILIDPDTRRDKLKVAPSGESSCRCHVLQSLTGCRMCAFWRSWVRDDVDLVASSAHVSPNVAKSILS